MELREVEIAALKPYERNAKQHSKEQVEKMVAHAMAKVKGLHGQWSVDILLDERGKFWLIDMAVAQRSAYWEQRPNKELYPE